MGNEAWLLLPVALACIYLAAVVAAVDGTIRAFRDRFLPPWVVGLVVVVLLVLLDQLLGTPLDGWGAFVAIPCGIVAGGVYGLRCRRHDSRV